MLKRGRLIYLCVLTFTSAALMFGCAVSKNKSLVDDDLQVKLTQSQELLKAKEKENLRLKEEIALFKKYQDVDSKKFILALSSFKKEFQKDLDEDDLWCRLSDRGMVIIVSAEKLFISGSDELSEHGREFLGKLCDFISSDFKDNYIYVEGHTDNQSLAIFEWKSNWEFSFARALSVVKYFSEQKGIEPLRLSASGFGQYRPRASNDTKEGRRLNRRIEIVISTQKLKLPAGPSTGEDNN